MNAAHTLDAIGQILAAEEWDAETIELVAAVVERYQIGERDALGFIGRLRYDVAEENGDTHVGAMIGARGACMCSYEGAWRLRRCPDADCRFAPRPMAADG